MPTGGGTVVDRVGDGETREVELPNGQKVQLVGTEDGFLLDAVHYRVGYPSAFLGGGMSARAVALQPQR